MLPRATRTRTARERAQLGGRTQEIQRLIGRSVRAMLDDFLFGEYTIRLDCDVLVADGGTRTAAITGAWVALALAVDKLKESGLVTGEPLRHQVAAVSVGIVSGEPRLDLCYLEDSAAATDMNCVGTDAGGFVEVQGTAEQEPFTRAEMDTLLDLAGQGLQRLFAIQREATGRG